MYKIFPVYLDNTAEYTSGALEVVRARTHFKFKYSTTL